MGTITIKVPQDIQLEYEIDTIDVIEGLLNNSSVRNNRLNLEDVICC